MSNQKEDSKFSNQGIRTHQLVKAGLPRRRAKENRFKAYGLICIVAGLGFLVILFGNIISHAWSAFEQTYIALDVTFDESIIDPEGRHDLETLTTADYPALLKKSMSALFPEVKERQQKRSLNGILLSLIHI